MALSPWSAGVLRDADPIDERQVIGAFAVYYREPRTPPMTSPR